jgi:predicted membrane-bound spermidine synthase
MPSTFRILLAVFFAGIVSLLLELSLLREFIYIFGSTARSNALIISVFLVGMAAGSYTGTLKPFKASPRQACARFWELQALSLVYIVILVATKRYFVYHCPHPKIVNVYFLAMVFSPAFISGLGYAYVVKALHERGERLITWVYGISTLGSVTGGLLHGLVLVPCWGMRSTYAVALCCAGAAAWAMASGDLTRRSLAGVLALVAAWSVLADPFSRAWPLPDLLFSKDSEFGIVEVWQMNPAKARAQNDRISFRPTDEPLPAVPVDIKINNVHQAYNLPVDRRIHEQWAATSLAITGHKARVLLFGYASGVTAAAYLDQPLLERLDIVENCDPVIEAGRRFFPKEYARVKADPRARMITDDFRGYARFTAAGYDVIAIDHSLQDPYQSGYFTTEFFAQLKSKLNKGGVVILLGEGLSWNTTRLSFPFIYRNIAPSTEPHIQRSCLYMMREAMPAPVAGDYTLVTDPLIARGEIYSDDRVWRR